MAAEDTSLKAASVDSGNAEIPMAVRRSTGARRSVKMTIFLKLVDGGRFSPLGRSCGLSTPATTKVKLIRPLFTSTGCQTTMLMSYTIHPVARDGGRFRQADD